MPKRYKGNGTEGGIPTVDRKQKKRVKPHEAYLKAKKAKKGK